MSTLKLAINGFGRIGRAITRVVASRDDVELVAINDTSNWEILAYLLQNDTTHKRFEGSVEFRENRLFINNKEVKISQISESDELDFSKAGADIVIESTGKILTKELANHHIKKGIKKVIFSAPPKDDTKTLVLGVNENSYSGESIISNASCTTNCIAPICKILDENFGIKSGIITTIHSYTNDQNLLDSAHRSDKRRSRSAPNNIIPTSTGAAKAIGAVLPSLTGILHGHSVRIPTPDVSMADLSFVFKKEVTSEEINMAIRAESEGKMSGILGIDDEYRVSSDFLGDKRSSIVASDLTFVINKNMAKIMAWYDNEWGYANRIVELALFIR